MNSVSEIWPQEFKSWLCCGNLNKLLTLSRPQGLLSALTMSIFLNTWNIDWHTISTILCLWNNESFFQGKILLTTRTWPWGRTCVFHMGFTTVGPMTLGNSLNTWPRVSLNMNSLQNSCVSTEMVFVKAFLEKLRAMLLWRCKELFLFIFSPVRWSALK